MKYYDLKSAYEFELISKNKVRCWHIAGGCIDVKVTIMRDKSLRVISENGNIFELSNEKLFNAIDRAYKHWKLI